MMAHNSILGSYLVEINELQQVQPQTLLSLPEPQRDLFNLSLILGLHIGLKLTMASALDGQLSLKVKVKLSYIKIWMSEKFHAAVLCICFLNCESVVPCRWDVLLTPNRLCVITRAGLSNVHMPHWRPLPR